MPENFKEYLFYLLSAPYKAAARAKNCWWMLASVIGGHFDELKTKIMWVREQAYLATCDPLLLPYYGEDRDMPQLKGESSEGYRRRLAMKYELAEKAGTSEGICLSVAALGCNNVYITPRYLEDAKKWAEVVLWVEFKGGAADTYRRTILAEANKVKPASAKLVLNSFDMTQLQTVNRLLFDCFTVAAACNNYYMSPVCFDGSNSFDGLIDFNQQIVGLYHLKELCAKYQFTMVQRACTSFSHVTGFSTEIKGICTEYKIGLAIGNKLQAFYTVQTEIRSSFSQPQSTSGQLIINTVHLFSGVHRFNGRRRFNSQITKEDL